MKILCTSDWHGDWISHGVDRHREIREAAYQTVECALDEKVDAYFFLGDLCDPDSGSRVFRCIDLAVNIAMKLAGNNVPSVWLVGNHDVIEDGSGDSTLLPLAGLGLDEVVVASTPQTIVVKGVPVVALPFTATSHTYDPLRFVRTATAGIKAPPIVIGHLSIPGVQPGEETKEMPRGRDVVFPTAAVKAMKPRAILHGHYHRRQVFDGIHIPGSLGRLTFGEEDHVPGFWLLEV